MRHLLFFSAIIVGAGWASLNPAMATSLAEPGLSGPKVTVTSVEKVGYWRRQYRRYGYPAPYAYYPLAYGYYPPPGRVRIPASRLWLPSGAPAYSPPVYGDEAPPPVASRSAEEDCGNYPPADGDYPAADGEYGDYPANGS